MKLGIAARLAVLMAVLGLLAAGMTAWLAERVSRSLLVESAQEALLTSSQVLARRWQLVQEDVFRDLKVISRHPAAQAALLHNDARAQQELATWFSLVMRNQPAYFQMRLIAADQHGLERVRVDRDRGMLLQVTEEDLQEKGHYAYVSHTLQLKPGQPFISSIVINHEDGAHDGLEQPSLIVAMPVGTAEGRVLGVVVINVDLKGAFALLSKDLPESYQLFLANAEGDILLHPDASRTFGFDRGQRKLLQEEMPALRALVQDRAGSVVVKIQDDAYLQQPMVAAFIVWRPAVPTAEEGLILGLAQPVADVLDRADRLSLSLWQLVLVVALGCLLLAYALARSFTHPLNALNRAVRRFAQVGTVPAQDLPLQRGDEIGHLARSFQGMQQQIQEQLQTLMDNQEELEHLSQHDMLTGLPNRRLFVQLLEQALVRAQRQQQRVAVMFLDLDEFKPVNDRWGHDVGDLLLKAIAQRLREQLRAMDVVARLGGDEFVILVDDPPDEASLHTLAHKLVEVVQLPVVVGGQSLKVGVSIGVACFPRDGEHAAELLHRADQAMYAAKEGGRHGYRFASVPPNA